MQPRQKLAGLVGARTLPVTGQEPETSTGVSEARCRTSGSATGRPIGYRCAQIARSCSRACSAVNASRPA
ncbi:hypothetical protein NKG94_02590 [Micromonospora sp. M12]